MPLSGRVEPGNAGLDARTQYAAYRYERTDDVPALRQSPRQLDFRAADERRARAGIALGAWDARKGKAMTEAELKERTAVEAVKRHAEQGGLDCSLQTSN